MKTKTKSKNKNRGKQTNRVAAIGRPLKPPAYNAVKATTRKYRFVASESTYASGTSPCVISSTKLCALEVIGTTTNVSATMLFEAVRVLSVKIWAWANMTSGTVTPASISCTTEGGALGALGNHKTISDTTQSIEVPAFVNFHFDDDMQAGQWQPGDTSQGSNSLFVLVVPTGAVIDVTCEFKATRNVRTTGNVVPLNVVVLTDYYYLALDNPAGGTGSVGNILIPDPSLHTTF
jgi:hypothetical protein